MQPGGGAGGGKRRRRKKKKERKYRAEMQLKTQMATSQLTELRVWVRKGAGQARTP